VSNDKETKKSFFTKKIRGELNKKEFNCLEYIIDNANIQKISQQYGYNEYTTLFYFESMRRKLGIKITNSSRKNL